MIDSNIKGLNNHLEPFTVGDLDPSKTFVHILDDDSLNTLMGTRDTISDFVLYLEKREKLIRGNKVILAPGEEELLAIYLNNVNSKNEHDFVFDENDDHDLIMIEEGFWEKFRKSSKRIAQLKADEISYVWDLLIDEFSKHALQGTQYYVSSGGIRDTEKILRFMASEPRVLRRHYSQKIKNSIDLTPNNKPFVAILGPMIQGNPHYVFLLYPLPIDKSITYVQYRESRMGFLRRCCLITKLKFPDAIDIVGIATESGQDNKGRSEDALYFNANLWDDEIEKEAKELLESHDFFKKHKHARVQIKEYPDILADKKPNDPKNKK